MFTRQMMLMAPRQAAEAFESAPFATHHRTGYARPRPIAETVPVATKTTRTTKKSKAVTLTVSSSS